MCTDFVLNNLPQVISGRTLDWEIQFAADLFSVPVGQSFESLAPKNADEKPLSWKNKYAFVGVEFRLVALAEALGGVLADAPSGTKYMALVDGMNEQGVSAALLWMPGSRFCAPSAAKPNLASLHIVTWIVSQFANVDEIIAGLREVRIWSGFVGKEADAHFAVHDADGNSLVIEFINEQMNLYHNKSEVLTNYPPLDWQLTNLDSFINLTSENVAVNVAGQEINGSGMLGLPGDATPPSRFVRTTVLKDSVPAETETQSGVEQALHLLNNVDVVQGEVRPSGASEISKPWRGDYTQWAVVRDHTRKTYYFRTFDNLNLRSVVLSELKSSEITYVSLTDSNSNWYDDITSSLQG